MKPRLPMRRRGFDSRPQPDRGYALRAMDDNPYDPRRFYREALWLRDTLWGDPFGHPPVERGTGDAQLPRHDGQ